MKRGLIILVLLFALPLVSAVPTFNLFNGEVLCSSDVETSYSIYVNVDNGTNSFNETGSVSSSGEYALVVGASEGYNISFYVDSVFVMTILYNESAWVRSQDLSLASDHDLCYEAPDNPPGGNPPSGDPPSGNPPSNPPSAYCGDGNCDSDESCSDCSEDCGQCPPPANDWDLSGPIVDVPQEGAVEVISIGGDYDLVMEGITTPFSIWDVSSENAKIDINGLTYEIPFEGTIEIEVGDYSVLASYLSNQDGKAKIAFNNAGIRAVSAFPGMAIVYWILGIIIFGVGVFFLVKWIKNRKSIMSNPKMPVKTALLKPSKGKGKIVNKKDRNLLSGPEN